MHAPSSPFHQVLESPLGWLGVCITEGGKVSRLEVLPGPATGAAPASHRRDLRVLDFLKSQLDSYFHRTCQTFNLPIHLAGDALEHRVWAETLLLRFGQCVNVAVLAQRVGHGATDEAVTAALRANPIVILVPSHRVLGWEETSPVPPWLATLRDLEDIVPGDSTCLTFGSLPSTAQELARAAARAPSATLHPKGRK